MTDNEIIKALECCGNSLTETCDNCPYRDNEKWHKTYCTFTLCDDALDLINRQKAEIERLTINMNAFGLGMKREKERADRNLDNLKAVLDERANHSEAVKEFAERLKEIALQDSAFGYVDCYDIDNLVKEFTEGDEGT